MKEEGGVNLYFYVGNNSVNAVDPFGLQNKADEPAGPAHSIRVYPELGTVMRNRSNCLGYAFTGRLDVYASPQLFEESGENKIRPSGKTVSIEKLVQGWGYKCSEKTQLKDCECECDHAKLVIVLWVNTHPENQGKDPWSEPLNYKKLERKTADGVKRTFMTDIHSMRAANGCSQEWSQVPSGLGLKRPSEKAHPPDKKKFEGKKFLCCCSIKDWETTRKSLNLG